MVIYGMESPDHTYYYFLLVFSFGVSLKQIFRKNILFLIIQSKILHQQNNVEKIWPHHINVLNEGFPLHISSRFLLHCHCMTLYLWRRDKLSPYDYGIYLGPSSTYQPIWIWTVLTMIGWGWTKTIYLRRQFCTLPLHYCKF